MSTAFAWPRARWSSTTWELLRSEGLNAIRWWSLEEPEAADAQFAPRRLPALVRELVVSGVPAEPVDVGV